MQQPASQAGHSTVLTRMHSIKHRLPACPGKRCGIVRLKPASAASRDARPVHMASSDDKISGTFEVLELYSGLGGMLFSLLKAMGPEAARLNVVAYDINEVANKVYAHNHKRQPRTYDLEQITAQQLDALGADLWCMSPPCQPYTTTTKAKRKDIHDTRAGSFVHLLQQLHLMRHPPKCILLENVSGFIRSHGHAALRHTLDELQYDVQEFDISPAQFCIPYLRNRYYCLAKRAASGSFLHPQLSCGINTTPPALPASLAARCLPATLQAHGVSVQQWTRPITSTTTNANDPSHVKNRSEDLVVPLAAWCELTGQPPGQLQAPWSVGAAAAAVQPTQPLASMFSEPQAPLLTPAAPEARVPLGLFLESGSWSACTPGSHHTAQEHGVQGSGHTVWDTYQLPTAKLAKYWKVLDLVTPESHHANCITKSYGKNMHSGGSLLVTHEFAQCFARVDDRGRLHIPSDPLLSHPSTQHILQQIRYLSPREVARLHGLPDVQLQDPGHDRPAFQWPEEVTSRQVHALLGNSLSTDCVAWLLCYLLHDELDS